MEEEENSNSLQYSCLKSIPGIDETGRLKSKGSQGIGQNCVTEHANKLAYLFS